MHFGKYSARIGGPAPASVGNAKTSAPCLFWQSIPGPSTGSFQCGIDGYCSKSEDRFAAGVKNAANISPCAVMQVSFRLCA